MRKSKPVLHITELSLAHWIAMLLAVTLLFMQYAFPAIHVTGDYEPAAWILWTMRFIVVFSYFGSWWFGASAIQQLHVHLFTLPEDSDTHRSLKWISRGVVFLILQFMITGLYLKVTRPYGLVGSEELKQVQIIGIILFTYVPLIGTACIYKGTDYIKKELKQQSYVTEYMLSYVMIACFVLGLLILVFTDIYRLTPPPLAGYPASFYVADWAIIIFYLLPLFITWILAVQAALRIHRYANEVAGLLYKKHYTRLSDGLRLTLFTIIITQFTLFAANRLALTGVEAVIAVLFVLSILSIYGLFVLARGVRGLTDIETIT